MVDRIFKVPQGQILPRPLLILRWIFFPLEMYVLTNRKFNYDWQRDIHTIYGVKYAGCVFRKWAKDGLPIGRPFVIEQRTNGVVTIKTLERFSAFLRSLGGKR